MENIIAFKKKINSYIKRVEDGNVCLLAFLDEAERGVVLELTKFLPINVIFDGGIVNANRVRCLLTPFDTTNEFNIHVYQIIYNKKFYEVNHRSILGSLMGLGIKRESVGDIVINGNKEAFFACTKEISPYIENDYKYVGKVPISIKKVDFPVKNEINYENKVYFVSSLRLDVVISASYNFSRKESLEVLERGEVFVNYLLNQNPSYILKEKDVISVRHKGNLIVTQIKGKSQSGRIIIEINKIV